MGIEHYMGMDGATIQIDDLKDIYEALDWLHTKAMDIHSATGCNDSRLAMELLETIQQSWDELDLPYPTNM